MNDPAPSGAAPARDPTAGQEYVEPGRSYRSVWLLAGVLVIGFGIDLALGVHGAVTHLPGWIVAAVLVLGADGLVIYAARAAKSLHVAGEHLRIGDDEVERAVIVSSQVGVDDEAPTLGWPTGMPRGMRGVTLTLTDGSALVVPTRWPARLRAALGHAGTTDVAAADAEIRAATDEDLVHLGELEERAGAVFAVSGYQLPDGDVPDYPSVDKIAIFVVGTPPVGFVHLTEVDGQAHVQEIAVLPKRMRQGIGTRLLDHAAGWASAQGYESITLTTYADVPWNGPYYAARGFAEEPASSPGLAELRRTEHERGLDDVGRRIVMRRELASSPTSH